MSKVDVLARCNEERSLIRVIRQRQLKFVGHFIREESIEKLAIVRKIAGKRAKGKQRRTYMEGLTSSVAGKLTSNELIHAAADRKRFKLMVANVRN